jgi:thiol-disulfide isomerase/thioredoxin
VTCWRIVLPLALLAAVLTSCTGVDAACDPIANVRQGLCLTPPADRQDAPTEAAEVLGEDRELSLEELRGQVVVVNFWASWCGPCRREQPELNAAYEQLQPFDVAFVGVDLQDPRMNAIAHEDEFEIPYPSIFDPASAFAAKFRGVSPSTIPSTVLVDRKGRVAVRVIGETDAAEVVSLARLLVAEDDGNAAS